MKRLLFAVALIALGAAPLLAHPTASSFVVVTISPTRTATIDITTDARSLVAKLEALGGEGHAQAVRTPSDHRARLAQLTEVLTRHVGLLADSVAVALTPGVIAGQEAANPGDERVRVTLVASLPNTARTVRWRSSLFLDSYPVLIRAGHPSDSTDVDAYEWLNGSQQSRDYSLSELDARGSSLVRFGRTVALGFTHILPGGLDHVLFVVGLFLLAGGTRALLLQITAFTVAHSVTLALAAMGFVPVPGAIVEPLIALSIAYVAIENLVTTSLSRWRLAVVFAFGLLHGLGFAGAFRELGVGASDLPLTLVGFNVGVELGQIAVVVLAAVVVRLIPIPSDRRRQWITVPASVAIAAMGIFWAFQRVA